MFRRRIRMWRRGPLPFRRPINGRWIWGGGIAVAVLVGLCALLTFAAIFGPCLIARGR